MPTVVMFFKVFMHVFKAMLVICWSINMLINILPSNVFDQLISLIHVHANKFTSYFARLLKPLINITLYLYMYVFPVVLHTLFMYMYNCIFSS